MNLLCTSGDDNDYTLYRLEEELRLQRERELRAVTNLAMNAEVRSNSHSGSYYRISNHDFEHTDPHQHLIISMVGCGDARVATTGGESRTGSLV